MKVPFVSFEPMHNEIEDEIKEVFNDIYSKNIFINGNYCKKFEHDFSEYCGTQYCVGTVKHYPIPIHKQEAYRNSEISKETYEISERISDTILSIPMYYGISEKQIEYVIDMLNRFDA